MDYIARIKDSIGDLDRNLARAEFQACSNISSDIIRASAFMDYQEGVFIGEYFESLFDNIASLVGQFKVDKNEIESIRSEIAKLTNLIKDSVPTTDVKVKSELYEMLVKVRAMVTESQIKYFREGKRKRIRTSERFRIPEEFVEE